MKCEHKFKSIEFERHPDGESFIGVWKICDKCNLVQLQAIRHYRADKE